MMFWVYKEINPHNNNRQTKNDITFFLILKEYSKVLRGRNLDKIHIETYVFSKSALMIILLKGL